MYSVTMYKDSEITTHTPSIPGQSIRNSDDDGTRIGCGGIRWHGSQEKRKRVAGGEYVAGTRTNRGGEQSSREQGAAPS